MSTLACKAVDLSIGGKQVVEGLDIEISEGQFWGLMGANGIGKTTLMRCLAGLIPPESGQVLLDGRPLSGIRRREVARRIGMLQQHTVYVFEATVMQTALMGRHPHLGRWQREGPDDVQRAETALHSVGLAPERDRNVTSLSGGEARRLAFAALLVQDPAVMLLDEPSNHLDLKHQVQIMSHIGDSVYPGTRSAVAAMHDINLAACYCSHVLMLYGDGQWAAGTAHDLFTRDNLEQLYQCRVQMIETPQGMRFHPSFEAISN